MPLQPPPHVPEQRGIFTQVAPSPFRAVARKAQGYTDRENAADGCVAIKTISYYIETARQKLNLPSTQELLWAYYAEYAPNLLYPNDPPGMTYGFMRPVETP